MNAPQLADSQPLPAESPSTGERLPIRLALFVLLLITTHAAQILMSQPAAYWLDPRITVTEWLVPVLLARGPWFFSAVVILYMAAAGLLLARLERSKALFLAGALVLLHTYFLSAGSQCRIPPFGWVTRFDNCGWTFTAQQWIWMGLFIVMVISLFPIPIRWPGRRWLAALGAVLAVGWLSLQVYGVVRSAVSAPTGWRVLAPAHSPAPRAGMGIAYDTARQRAVLFGGEGTDLRNYNIMFSDTWEWDGQDWQQIHTEVSPPARRMPSFAYDEKRGVMVLYGGWSYSGMLKDVWEYDGKAWVERCPYCTPAARWGATMLYDPQLEKVVLYGGVSEGEGEAPDKWHTEAWAWDGYSWEYTGIDAAAPAAFKPGLVYDPDQERTLAFVDMDYGGTWIWDDRLWQRSIMAVQPTHAAGSSLIYDPLYRRILLYGGVENPGVLFHNQTWVYEDDTWQQIVTPRSPMPRKDQVGFYDPTRQSMIVFGGRGIEGSLLNDTWELPLANASAGLPAEGNP